jgi:hypothetical protein
MNVILPIAKKAHRMLLRMAVVALGVGMCCVHQAWADVAGPVVGFVRVAVDPGPQWVAPTVQPFAPKTDEGETQSQTLTDYMGNDFFPATNATNADWIGFASTEDGDVTMIWRDQQGQWHDLLGNTVDPACTGASGFWVDLVFDADELNGMQPRELVLSGQVVW